MPRSNPFVPHGRCRLRRVRLLRNPRTRWGTDLHEAPTIGDRVTGIDEGQTLEAGMVVALEPGILVPGVGGGHQEDMVLITENGPEVLTKAPFDEDLLG